MPTYIAALFVLALLTIMLVRIQPSGAKKDTETEPGIPEIPDFCYELDDEGKAIYSGWFEFANGDKMPIKAGTHVDYVIDPQTGLKAKWHHNPKAIEDGIVTSED